MKIQIKKEKQKKERKIQSENNKFVFTGLLPAQFYQGSFTQRQLCHQNQSPSALTNNKL